MENPYRLFKEGDTTRAANEHISRVIDKFATEFGELMKRYRELGVGDTASQDAIVTDTLKRVFGTKITSGRHLEDSFDLPPPPGGGSHPHPKLFERVPTWKPQEGDPVHFPYWGVNGVIRAVHDEACLVSFDDKGRFPRESYRLHATSLVKNLGTT